MTHECYIPEWEIKNIKYGNAIDLCYEDDNGELIVEGDGKGNQVNFCPFCGYKAKVQIEHKPKRLSDK